MSREKIQCIAETSQAALESDERCLEKGSVHACALVLQLTRCPVVEGKDVCLQLQA